MSRFGVTSFMHNGISYALFKDRIKNHMATDGKANPVLWFVKELKTQDYPVCGVDTATEALDAIGVPDGATVRGRLEYKTRYAGCWITTCDTYTDEVIAVISDFGDRRVATGLCDSHWQARVEARRIIDLAMSEQGAEQ